VSTPILFSPDDVVATLAALPSVASLLPPPAVEGVPSEAFPGVLRKTGREVYRWVANTHYEHLAKAVLHLERAHAAGCTFGDLLTTTSREQFVSLSAEVLVADDLLRRGYTVSTIPRLGQPGPDLHFTVDEIDVAVEVYSPRELLAIDAWINEVNDLLNYVDVPASYRSRVETKFERVIPPDPRWLDPWLQAEMLAQTREDVIAEMSHDVETALRALRPLDRVYAHPGTPLLKKARRRQAQGVAAAARALVVYMMGTKIAEDLAHPAHLSGAEAALDEIDPQQYGLDVIAFVVRALPLGLAALITVADDTTLTLPQVEAMFG
jgi:hypothetical protein